jgi:hypothetical protein
VFVVLGCFASGILDLLSINILCESLPVFLRGSFICLSLIGYSLSDFFNNILINSFTDKNFTNIKAIMFINTGVILLILILFYALPLSDSARNLMFKGEFNEAFDLLKKLKGADLSQEEKKELIDEVKLPEEVDDCYFDYISKSENQKLNLFEESEIDKINDAKAIGESEKLLLLKTEIKKTENYVNNDTEKSNIDQNYNNNSNKNVNENPNDEKLKEQNKNINNGFLNSLAQIFSKEHLKQILIFISIRFILNFVLSGSTNIIGLYLSKIINESDIEKISSAQVSINLITMLSFPLSALLIEIKFLGRKSALIILASLSLITLICLFFFPKIFYLLGIFFVFYFSKIYTIITLTSETFPTKVRDITLGLINLIKGCGSVLGIVAYILLLQRSFLIPHVISFVLICVCFGLFFLIEKETKNKALDLFFDEDKLKKYIVAKEADENKELREVVYSN